MLPPHFFFLIVAMANDEKKCFRFARVAAYDGGIGVFATRDIRLGEVVLQERPLILATTPETLDVAMANLGPKERKQFLSLTDWRNSPKTALGIFQSNGYPCGEEAGVFFEFSRFNHSCGPNASHAWRHGCRYVFAAKNIKAGEELCTNYIDLAQPRSQRRALLKEHFGFDCCCSACASSEDSRTSDTRRHRIANLDDITYDDVSHGRYDEALKGVEERIALLKAEGIDSPATLVRCAYDAYQAMDHKGDFPEATLWLKRVIDFSRLCEPPDSEEISSLEAKLATLRRRSQEKAS